MDAMPNSAGEMTQDELREALAGILPGEAAFDGWSGQALASAAAIVGVSTDRAELAFPGGAVDMIDAWFAAIDREMAHRLPPAELSPLRIRARIERLVWTRVEIAAAQIEALRRAVAILAVPVNAPRAARLAWRAADAMWRIAGDDATGPAYYSKRATLAGVYTATILALLADESEDHAETRAFLGRRIGDVMRFERLKAGFRRDPYTQFSVTRFLGRLRYPAR